MKVYTSKLGPKALKWAVVGCEIKHQQQTGRHVDTNVLEMHAQARNRLSYYLDDDQAYQIIKRENIRRNHDCKSAYVWSAWTYVGEHNDVKAFGVGSSEVQAAMRCYVSSVMGEVVDVPEHLVTRTIHEIVTWDGRIIASVLQEQDVGWMFDYFQDEYLAPVGGWSMSSRWREITDFRYATHI